MATRTKWLLISIFAVVLVPIILIPLAIVGMINNRDFMLHAANWFGLLAGFLGLFVAAMYALPLRVPRLRRRVYGPEWTEHFNYSERKPLIERFVVSWAAAWLFIGGGNLIRSFNRFLGSPTVTILDVIPVFLPFIGIMLLFNGFRYKLALDNLVEKERQADGT